MKFDDYELNEMLSVLWERRMETERQVMAEEKALKDYSGCDCHPCKHRAWMANEYLPSFKQRLKSVNSAINKIDKEIAKRAEKAAKNVHV